MATLSTPRVPHVNLPTSAHPQGHKATIPVGLLGCAHPGLLMLLLCGLAAAGATLVEVSPQLGQERSKWGAGSPVGALSLVASHLRQLGSIESQCVVEELVLLARLDHPAPARERQAPLTPHQSPQPQPRPLLPGHKYSCFTRHVQVHLRQVPELLRECLGSQALLGCSKCRLATDLSRIFTSTSPEK